MPPPQTPELLEHAQGARITAELAARAIGLLDLTSLSGQETADGVRDLCQRAIAKGVAAVCIYPQHLREASAILAGSDVRLATVANFPDGSDDLARTADEVAAAIAEGADEIDVVAPLSALEEGDLGLLGDLVEVARAAARPGITLKLILETGRLKRPDLIAAAARTAVMAGVDFLKTSTGKIETGATLEAAAILLAVLAEADGRVGLKVAGGVRRAEDAARYLALADAVMGPTWVARQHFRIEASTLLDELVGWCGPAAKRC